MFSVFLSNIFSTTCICPVLSPGITGLFWDSCDMIMPIRQWQVQSSCSVNMKNNSYFRAIIQWKNWDGKRMTWNLFVGHPTSSKYNLFVTKNNVFDKWSWVLFVFLFELHCLQDLSSPTRDWTWALPIKESHNHWTTREFPDLYYHW